MEPTITTTVKAAGEAFAELDTIVVVAYVAPSLVGLQLVVVAIVNIALSWVVVVRICKALNFKLTKNKLRPK